jgi:hypothetical protein
MANTTPQTGYAPVNGLNIYYEIRMIIATLSRCAYGCA